MTSGGWGACRSMVCFSLSLSAVRELYADFSETWTGERQKPSRKETGNRSCHGNYTPIQQKTYRGSFFLNSLYSTCMHFQLFVQTHCCWPAGRSPAGGVTLLLASLGTEDRLPVWLSLWWGGWDWRHEDEGTGWRCSLEPRDQRRSHDFPLYSFTDVGV